MALADRLDAAQRSDQGVALQAVPGIAKQLSDSLDALGEQSSELEGKIAELFSEV